ncbi:hypothetical protein MNBD_NITROSPINAE01-1590 [hydrothermal vent metagenome]|uniref:Uncharacterized protein n=1 Tax=hydrothermal vent metagenome TaxID=652676 RepID=A0A3B1BVC1_9ZZZZ
MLEKFVGHCVKNLVVFGAILFLPVMACGPTSTDQFLVSPILTTPQEITANEKFWLGTWNLNVNEGAVPPSSTGIISGTLVISVPESETARSTFTSVRTIVWGTVTCIWTGSHIVDYEPETYEEIVTASECTPAAESTTETVLNSGFYSFSEDNSVLTAGPKENKWVWDRM